MSKKRDRREENEKERNRTRRNKSRETRWRTRERGREGQTWKESGLGREKEHEKKGKRRQGEASQVATILTQQKSAHSLFCGRKCHQLSVPPGSIQRETLHSRHAEQCSSAAAQPTHNNFLPTADADRFWHTRSCFAHETCKAAFWPEEQESHFLNRGCPSKPPGNSIKSASVFTRLRPIGRQIEASSFGCQ